MKNLIFFFLFTNLFALGFSQDNAALYPDFREQDLNSIEKNTEWNVLNRATGDLNKDGLSDYALILESQNSILEKRCGDCKMVKSKPRIIVVLLGQNIGEKVIIQNNEFIIRDYEGGMTPDLQPEISIENSLLTIHYQFTRSNQSYTFSFQNNLMEIIKAESHGVHNALGDFESDVYDFKQGVILSESGNIGQEKVVSKEIRFDTQPKSLSELGRMSTWKIAENKYL